MQVHDIYQVLRISEELLARHFAEVANRQSATLLHHVVVSIVFPESIFMQLVLQQFYTWICLKRQHMSFEETTKKAPSHGQVDVDKQLLFSLTGGTHF